MSINYENKNWTIPSIKNNPVKFLGRKISFSLKDKDQVEVFSLAVSEGLTLIDKSFHRGVHKLWILQHLLIPRLRWPLLIYEIPVSTVARLEQKISCFIRKWLKLHNSTSNICLYSSSSPCPLPIKSLSSIHKAAKVSGHLLLRESADKYVSEANIRLQSGKWQVSHEVNRAEELLEFKKILGYHQTNRAGFGSYSIPEVPPKRSHEYRKLLSSLVLESDESNLEVKAVQLSLQGQWTRWCNFVRFDLSWKTLLAMPQPLISFCIGATYDTLPSPSNLHRWKISTEKFCFLCGKSICTTAHILGACKTALDQGRFTFRHDSVLSVLLSFIKEFLKSYKVTSSDTNKRIKFVKAGAKVPKNKKSAPSGLLHLASDWSVLCDLESPLVVPPFLAVTRLRPDMLLYSIKSKICIILELTCCCEENIEEWHRKKFFKYESLSKSVTLNGWEVHLFPVEVGARGYCGSSIKSCFMRLGFTGKSIRSLLKTLSLTSMKASFHIWQSRNTKEWTNPLPTSLSSNQFSTPHDVNNNALASKPRSCKKKKDTPAPCKEKEITSPLPVFNVGILNKGNTCYLNSVLQCLSVVPELWSNVCDDTRNQVTFFSSFLKIMTLLKTSKTPLDPSQFLRFLKQILIKSGRIEFNLFQQQDACEILSCILDEFCGHSLGALDLIKTQVRNTTTCNTCFQSSVQEDMCKILQLSICHSTQQAIETFLKPEELHGRNKYYCNFCASLQTASLEHEIVNSGGLLIIQLKRFASLGNSVAKDVRPVKCDQEVRLPVVFDRDIVNYKRFRLLASVNHSGTLERGHYTALIKNITSSTWFHCNDAAVIHCNESVPQNLSYILFYKAVE